MCENILLTTPEQARPIISEYLAILYRQSQPVEELHVLLPDGRYAEIFPAYVEDNGLLQVDFWPDASPDELMEESQNVDKFRTKRHFARNFANQVEYVLELLWVIPRSPDFFKKDSLGKIIPKQA